MQLGNDFVLFEDINFLEKFKLEILQQNDITH